MDFRQLRYVVAIAHAMHFTRAAEELGVAQPALSQAIALLEKRLDVALFVRNSRRVQLTPAGRMFVERAEQILREIDSLQRNMQEHAQTMRGQVNIGTMVFFFFGRAQLAEAVSDFVKTHPGVEISVENNTIEDSLEAVRAGEIDIALINMPDNVTCPDLHVATIGHDEIVAALPPNHRLATNKEISLPDLHDEPFIAYKPGTTMHDALNALSMSAGFHPRASVRSRNIILVRSLVSAGAGVSIGPKSYLMSPGPPVETVPLVPRRQVSIAMVTRPGAQENRAARALIDFFRTRFAGDIDWADRPSEDLTEAQLSKNGMRGSKRKLTKRPRATQRQ